MRYVDRIPWAVFSLLFSTPELLVRHPRGTRGLALTALWLCAGCQGAAWRTQLADQGVELAATYTGDAMRVVSGGAEQGGVYLSNLDLTAHLDGEKRLGWDGAEFFLYLLGNNGKSPSRYAGDLQGVSNIDAPDTFKVYEAYYQQWLAGDRLSVLAGLYDLNSEFDAMDTASLFLNSSHGIGPEYAQSGLNGPSIFPTTSLALRVRSQPRESFYAQVAVLDAVPGDLDDAGFTHVHLRSREGALFAAELGGELPEGFASLPPTRLALGGWLYSARFDHIWDPGAAEPERSFGNFGVYALAETDAYWEPRDRGQGLALFGRIGLANGRYNTLAYYAGAGAVYTGLIPGRDADQLGFALAAAIAGSDGRRALRASGVDAARAELALEFTYRYVWNDHLAVQPNLQWVIHPGLDRDLSDSWVIGARLEVGL